MHRCRRLVLLAAILTLFLLQALFINLFGIDPARLGLSAPAALLLLAASLLGSAIDLPLPGGLISLNLGGAVVPVGLAAYLLGRAPLIPTLIATLAVAALCRLLARPHPEFGVSVPMLVPAVCAAILASLLVRPSPAPVAFISGVAGTLIGTDLLYLPHILKRPAGRCSIGGAGVYDAILLVAIVAAFLT